MNVAFSSAVLCWKRFQPPAVACRKPRGRWLKLISGPVILLLGLVMIFKPEWLG